MKTRSNEGIQQEIKDLQICLKKEQSYLANGQRRGTFHNPLERIKSYTQQISKLEKQL